MSQAAQLSETFGEPKWSKRSSDAQAEAAGPPKPHYHPCRGHHPPGQRIPTEICNLQGFAKLDALGDLRDVCEERGVTTETCPQPPGAQSPSCHPQIPPQTRPRLHTIPRHVQLHQLHEVGHLRGQPLDLVVTQAQLAQVQQPKEGLWAGGRVRGDGPCSRRPLPAPGHTGTPGPVPSPWSAVRDARRQKQIYIFPHF